MPHIRRRAFAAGLALSGLMACEGANPVQPRQTPTAPVAQQATTPAAAEPTPNAPPSDPAPQDSKNHPPTVTLTGGGSCHPRPGKPCTVEFQADASDRDGDPIRLEWRGCTSGTGYTELCTIDHPGVFTANVIVTDSHGATARATATADGTNLLPVVHIGPNRPPDPAPANTHYTIVGDEPYDPDDYGPYSNQACPHARVTTRGPCRAAIGLCGGVGDAFDIDLTTLPGGPGICIVEATVTDPWGAVGSDRFSFHVLAP